MTRDAYIRLLNLRYSILRALKGSNMLVIEQALLGILTQEITKGVKEHSAHCLRCGGTEISHTDRRAPFCANSQCSHQMIWGEIPTDHIPPFKPEPKKS